jgi:hypothetical protein
MYPDTQGGNSNCPVLTCKPYRGNLLIAVVLALQKRYNNQKKRPQRRLGVENMNLLQSAALAAALALNASTCLAVCVNFDGGNNCIEVGNGGNIPMPTGVERVGPSPSSSGGGRQQSTGSTTTRTAPKVIPPSMKSIVGSAIIGGVIGGLLESVFESPTPAAPTGPTPAEIEAQRQRQEQQRIEDERRHQAFLRSKSELSGRLRGPGTSYAEDKNITSTGSVATGGLMLKSIQVPTAGASSGNTHSGFFGQPAANPSVALLRDPLDGAGNGLLSPEAYRQAISNPDLTQEERERLFLRTKVASGPVNDHPMIDSRAFVKKEQYSDVYLDIATAGAKAGLSTLTLSLVDEGGKSFLKTRNVEDGFDELVTLGRNTADSPGGNAGKVVALGDFALTKAPSWTIFVDAAVNAGGAATRQAFVRYWAAQSSHQSEYVPNPRELAAQRWDGWVSDQNEWTKAALGRISAGGFK